MSIRLSENKLEHTASKASYTEHRVPRLQHRLYARDYPGAEPAIILLHGFPDNLHLYDRVVPLLNQTRRVITFDYLGWGQSDKPTKYPYTHDNMTVDIEAVVRYFNLSQVVLVAHDASGPSAIDWALNNPSQTGGLILLNTYYNLMPGLRLPEAIFLFSTPVIRIIARAILAGHIGEWLGTFQRLYRWQVGKRFIGNEKVREQFVPLLFEQFINRPSAQEAFLRLNRDLYPAVLARNARVAQAHKFRRPVRIIFGKDDPYLNEKVAQGFQKLFPVTDIFLLPEARHFPQLEKPEEVAKLILATPLAN